ncbi:MAG: hypothetical protein NUV82_03600 [Candidatus Komeilibacteria bacterium]|nr:hypothetical protein [Candidatus Komeilibacteria bacterium]
MILIGRLLNFFIPVIYLVSVLVLQLQPSYIFISILVVVGLILVQVWLMAKRTLLSTTTSGWWLLLKELLSIWILIGVSYSFLVFMPFGWEYFAIVVVFSFLLYGLLRESFSRFHPALIRSMGNSPEARLMYFIVVSFFIVSAAYNFILFLTWSLPLTLSLVIVLLLLILLTQQDSQQQVWLRGWGLVAVLTTAELFLILYYLPIDIYLKAMIIALNELVLIEFIFKKNNFKLYG